MTPDALLDGLKFSIQIAKGLVSLHDDLRMVHQDLKPSNILLFGDSMRIADFGLCCSSTAFPAERNKTATYRSSPG
jgi:serine/threonine protein kinase